MFSSLVPFLQLVGLGVVSKTLKVDAKGKPLPEDKQPVPNEATWQFRPLHIIELLPWADIQRAEVPEGGEPTTGDEKLDVFMTKCFGEFYDPGQYYLTAQLLMTRIRGSLDDGTPDTGLLDTFKEARNAYLINAMISDDAMAKEDAGFGGRLYEDPHTVLTAWRAEVADPAAVDAAAAEDEDENEGEDEE